MRDVCSICARRIPTFVVSRRGNYGEGYLPPNAIVLKQSAGRFLISTLPNFFRQETIDALECHTESEEDDTSSVLEWLMIASDHNQKMDNRSAAIEELAGTRVRLERQEIEQLLRADELQIRTYALGLIQDSPDRDALIKVARSIATENGEPVFEKETQILVKLLGQGKQK